MPIARSIQASPAGHQRGHVGRPPRSPGPSNRLRACWVTQALSGLAVTPPRWTCRVSSSMKNK
jgi:hypothetical protein